MPTHVQCRLRTQRRLWGLNQQELATLLGCGGATHISRIERGERTPTLSVALASELLFGSPPKRTFSLSYQKTEEELMRRVYAMHQRLAKSRRPADLRKRELLESCLKRAVKSSK